MNCLCGHARRQHSLIFGMCTASRFSSLVGASPDSTCGCLYYTPVVPLGTRLLARIFGRSH